MNKRWKKWLSLGVTLGLMLGAAPQSVWAYNVPEVVTVGLESVCKNTTSASLGGTEFLIGTQRGGRFSADGTITSSRGFTATLKTGELVAVEEMDRDEAMEVTEVLERMGYDAYLAYLGGEWSVYVENASVSEVEREARMSASKVQGGGVLIGGSESVFLPRDSEGMLMGTEKNDTFSINGKSYRGCLSFAINGVVMTAVNTLGLEEYLYGVVPSEMPQSYEKEALKAQAVAARTYAMTKLGAHSATGYQLCDTINCQVYKGYSGEAANTTSAIDATAGQIACYNGTPIEAVFSASSGGYTENSENVWNAVVPYLRAVPEIAEYGDNTWTVTLTLDDLDDLLSAKNANIGSAEDIVITKLSTGGRVQEMKIVGSRSEVTLTKENIRTYFSAASSGSLPGKMFTINGKGGDIGVYGGSLNSGNQGNNSGGGSVLASVEKNGIMAKTEGTLSALNGKKLTIAGGSRKTGASVPDNEDYEVYSVDISTVNGRGEFVFEGVGKGHGVGLSQKGAQSMAMAGHDYEEILQHYYTGITIEG